MALGKAESRLKRYLEKFIGPSGSLLAQNAIRRAGINDLDRATDTQLFSLKEDIEEYVLEPMLQGAKLALARSELLRALGLDIRHPGQDFGYGLMKTIDGINVLPQDIDIRLIEHMKDISDFIMAQEMARYGLKNLKGTDSGIRHHILRAFVKAHFGESGISILESKICEFRVQDLCSAPVYAKNMLIEYIIQSMLAFYVEPLKARFLRSELMSITGVETCEVKQSDKPDIVKLKTQSSPEKHLSDTVELVNAIYRRSRGIGMTDPLEPKQSIELFDEISQSFFGQMGKFIIESASIRDIGIKKKFLARYMDCFIKKNMTAAEGDILKKRIENVTGMSFLLYC